MMYEFNKKKLTQYIANLYYNIINLTTKYITYSYCLFIYFAQKMHIFEWFIFEPRLSILKCTFKGFENHNDLLK